MSEPHAETTAPATTRAEAPPLAPAFAGRWAALPVLMVGTFMIVLDFFVINVALPSLQVDLHASASAIEWVVAGYGLTFAACHITGGRLGDQIGRRRVFSIGVALFVFASAACGAAPNPTLLVIARLLQGLAASLISPNVLSIIGVVFTGADRPRALSVYGIVMGLAAAGGQLVGGLLIRADVAGLGWRAIFLVNVPIGVAALLLAARLVPESRAERPSRLDLVGMLLITLGLGATVLPLIDGRQQGWPIWTWLSLAGAPILLGGFAAHQLRLSRRGGSPLLDPALFTMRAFAAGLLTQLAFFGGLASFFLVLALYLQQGRGLDALGAGLVFSILAAAYLATSLHAPALTIRLGRGLITVGALTLAAGLALLLATVLRVGSGGPIVLLAPGLLLVGAGQGLCITPLATTVLASADPQRAGGVSGALSTTQQMGNALGVAATGVIFFDALPDGVARAFALSLGELAALLVAVAGLTLLLPARQGGPNARMDQISH